MAIGSFLGITYIPAGVIDQIQPYWRAIVTVVIILTGILGTNALRIVYQNFMLNQEVKIETKRAALVALARGNPPEHASVMYRPPTLPVVADKPGSVG